MSNNGKNTTLQVEGMTCSSCAMGVTKSLENMGLEEVNTSFVSGEVTFTNTKDLNLDKIKKTIKGLGYHVAEEGEQIEQKGLSTIEKKFWFSLIFTFPLFLHMFMPMHWYINHPIVQIVLCLPVFTVGLLHFGKSALTSLKTRVANMDVLILIGSVAAFAYSLAGTILYWETTQLHNYLFFETTATIITLVLLGNVLEHRSVTQTTTAIRELSKLQEIHAKKVVLNAAKEETIVEVHAHEIRMGDLLIVNTGDQIPTDGKIARGAASVDESMLTGESLPVNKQGGDEVIGGTILTDGNLRIMATKVGHDTVLSKIIELVKNAQNDKPDIQKLGDKISGIFVPAVLSISLITFLLAFFAFDIGIQQALMNSIAVLVISCPCAMGLATPTAVIAGLGRAAKNGILIKGGSTLEIFAKTKNMVFDKTGTLTTGDFQLSSIDYPDEFNEEQQQEVRNIIYSLEMNSSHPIAKSLVKQLKGQAKMLLLSQIEEIKGKGISATYNQDDTIELGSAKWLNHNQEAADALFLHKNNHHIATIYIKDELKTGAGASIQSLSKLGINAILLSGDRKEKCETVAKAVHIPTVHSEKLPEEKLQIIEELGKNEVTTMVGDGINDAPALAKADVGISLSNATQVAIQSAQIVLINDKDLSKISDAYLISKHTVKTIKQNLFWAFFYNVVAIPIAAFGLLNPMVAALAMAFSDVVVIGNSIRLKTKKLD
jgi:Cu+-exporting ATPase